MTTAVEWETKWGQKIGASKARMIAAGINWELDALMLEQGILNAAQLHELLKTSDAECTLEEVEALHQGWMPARTRDGEWHSMALGICDVLGCTPEAVFDHEHQWHPEDVVGNLAATVGYDEISRRRETSQGISQDEAMINAEMASLVRTVLRRLSPREERIIRSRFGFGGEAMEYKDIAAKFDLSIVRIRQIESKGLRKLKHPRNSAKLRRFLEERTCSRPKRASEFNASMKRAPIDPFPRKHVYDHLLNKKDFIAWPNLQGYGLSMKIYFLSGNRPVIAIGTDHSSENYKTDATAKGIGPKLLLHRDTLLKLGFKECKNGMFANFGAAFSIYEFSHHLPLTMREEVSLLDVMVCRPAPSSPGMRM